MRLPPEVVEEAKEIVREVAGPYPQLDEDVGRALRSRQMWISLIDAVWLLKYQNRLCSKCGECCRRVDAVRVTVRDLKRIAKHLKTSVDELSRILKLRDRGDGSYSMEGPCPFLRGNLCSIHPARPNVCRYWPANYVAFQMAEGKAVELPIYCSIVREMYVQKLAATVLWTRFKRENPKLAGQVKKLMGKLLKPPEDMDKQPIWERVEWIIERIEEAGKHLEIK